LQMTALEGKVYSFLSNI